MLQWLLAYFQAYAWGIAFGLGVNLLVLPVSSETELRSLLTRRVSITFAESLAELTLVHYSSLQHVSTLSHLACKTYTKDIAPDEQEVRHLLVQTIRNDFYSLTARLDEASYEIRFTQFDMSDYRAIIDRVRGLQQVCCSLVQSWV
jgi:hypothetical protein